MEKEKYIEIYGAAEHNLKNIDVFIPHNSLTVITGVSGSGKSSLAYDILFAEGQRRYIESLSTYARQFLGKIRKPQVRMIKNLAPAVAIRQKTSSANARSTVGTATEIYDYLKLLFARVGRTISPVSGEPVVKHTVDDVMDFLWSRPEDSRWILSIPVPLERERDVRDLLRIYKNRSFSRVWADGRVLSIDAVLSLEDDRIPGDLEVIIDRIIIGNDLLYKNRVAESVESAFFYGHGRLYLTSLDTKERHTFSNKFEKDGMEFPEPSVHLFSFNNPYGACPVCEGYGSIIGIDPKKVIPDPRKSVFEGAVAPWTGNKLGRYRDDLVFSAHRFDFPVHTPWKDLPEEHKKLVWEGNKYFTGIRDFFKQIEAKTYKIQNRVLLSRYRGKTVCPACGGKRLRKEAYYVYVGGKNIGELVEMPVGELKKFFDNLKLPGAKGG
jgi:excinuclease ABC subunit A